MAILDYYSFQFEDVNNINLLEGFIIFISVCVLLMYIKMIQLASIQTYINTRQYNVSI